MFDIDFQEKGSLLLHTRKFLLYPQYWNEPSNEIKQKLSWDFVRFSDSSTDRVPEKKGLYCFVVSPSVPNFFQCQYLFYIGKTNRTLKERFGEYLREQNGKGKPRPKVYEMLRLYRDHLFFHFSIIDDSILVDHCEELLINTFVPFINTAIPNAKIKSELIKIYEH